MVEDVTPELAALKELVATIRRALDLSDRLGHDRVGIPLSEALERAGAIADAAVREGRPR